MSSSPRAALAGWIVLLLAIRVSAVPPERPASASAEALRTTASRAADWMIRNQRADGSYLYDYDPSTNRSSGEYNEVRHAGVTMALYQAAGRLRDPRALYSADRGLAWMQAALVRRSDWAALAPSKQQASLGASALMLVGLTERRRFTGDPRFDPLMHELARFLVSLEADDGSFARGYDFAAGSIQPGPSTYYPGESAWALVLMHDAFPGEGWDVASLAALEYIATRRDEVEKEPYPPFNDQWAAYTIAELARLRRLSPAQVEYARRLAARFGLLARTEAQRDGSSYGRFLRGDTSRGARAGTWVEGLAALWRASRYEPRLSELREPLAARARSLASIMADRQVTPEVARTFSAPAIAEGAWFDDDETRMDDQQHAFSGLLYTVDVVEDRMERAPEEIPSP